MKLVPLSLGLIGLLAGLGGPDRLLIGDHAAMPGKATASDTGPSGGDDGTQPARSGRAPSMAPARDPSAAVAEEFEAARRSGTREAWELFLARHGDDPLAERARAELGRLPR
jgi:hypothetical protein